MQPTFENFLRGDSNALAAAAAEAVADNPGRAFNPLFLYGGNGLGKTHLLHAISSRIQSRNPQMQVVHLTAERFTNEMIDAIGDEAIRKFRQKYRSVDVLMIDHLQFLVSKQRTQEEFFHTFRELIEDRRQIVLASDRGPKLLPCLAGRLRTCFEYGLLADIQPPELELRLALLRQKCPSPVPDHVLRCLAERIPTNVACLEGALTRLLAYCRLLDRPVDLAAAEQVLRAS